MVSICGTIGDCIMRFLSLEACRTLSFLAVLSIVATASGGTPVVIPTNSAQRPLLKSIYAGSHQVSDFFDDQAEVVAFVFISRTCPVAQQYVPTLNKLYRRLHSDGIRFVGVYSNGGANITRGAA